MIRIFDKKNFTMIRKLINTQKKKVIKYHRKQSLLILGKQINRMSNFTTQKLLKHEHRLCNEILASLWWR